LEFVNFIWKLTKRKILKNPVNPVKKEEKNIQSVTYERKIEFESVWVGR